MPGLFCVKTRFAHIWFLPLIPLASELIFDSGGGSWFARSLPGVPIGLSARSVLVAWFNAAAILLGIVTLGQLVKVGAGQASPFQLAMFAIALFVVLTSSRLLARPTLNRCIALGSLLEIGADDVLLALRPPAFAAPTERPTITTE